MDKRGHPRFSSRFNAQLVSNGGDTIDCKVLDFSQDGIRVQWGPEVKAAFQSKEILTLAINFEKVPARIPVQVLNQEGSTAGLKFHQPNTDLFLRLQTLNQKTQAPSAVSPERQQKLRKEITHRYGQVCKSIIDQWSAEILDEVFQRASLARNNEEQQNLLLVERNIKQSNSRMLPRFMNTMGDQQERWLKGKPALSFENEGDEVDLTLQLSLIQQEDFEGWLLSKVTSSHLQSRLSDLSFDVHQLLDQIAEKNDDPFNPLDSKVITDAFSHSIEPLKLEVEYLRLCYEVFERACAQHLKPFYQSVIKLIDIPLVFRYRKPAKQPSRAATTSAEAANTESNTPAQAPAVSETSAPSSLATPKQGTASLSDMSEFQRHQAEAQQAYANIQSLMSMKFAQAQQPDSIPPETAPVATPVQISDAVSDLWQQMPELPQANDSNIRSQIEQLLEQNQMALPQENREAMDTLEHITQHLHHNENLPDFIKPYISQLEWPLTKLMLQDASIMFNPQHPGRIALNSLAKLGRLTMAGQDIVQDKLNSILSTVQPDSEDLQQQLETLLHELNHLVKDAERKAQLNADRVAQAAEGEFKVWQSREIIRKQIDKDLSGKTLPNTVLQWIEEGWKPLLSLIYLREGKDSKRLAGAIKLYRQISSIFSDKMVGRSDILPKLTSLLQLMRHELDQMNGPRPEHMQWYDGILELAKQHLSGQDLDDTTEMPEHVEEATETADADSKGLRKALNLQEGDWLLRIDQDQAISIVWIADDGSKFACVNHSGMKVIDFSLEELAKAFDNGEIKRLYEQEKTAVDRSLDAMVQQIYSDLSAQANIDDLTELNTRQHFIRQLKSEIVHVQRYQSKDTLCFVDIDQFKLINSEYGVEGGDACLKMIAEKLLEMNDAQYCARMGSNEFAVIFTNADLLEGEKQAKDLKDRIEKTEISSPQGSFYVRASFGITEINSDTVDETDLIEFAESACFQSKNKGGSKIQSYQSDDDRRIERDAMMSWGNKLNQALENDQLNLICQPLTNIQPQSANEHTYEVSVSIRDKDGEIIPPYEYLQASKHYGRLHLIDRWVLENLMRWMGENTELVSKIDRFMLKLSGHTMNDESLLPLIFSQSKVHKIPVNKLCFELNETAAIHDIEDASDFMHEMNSLGCQFVLSDFGTGQSSFQYLKRLPVDFVKIDRALIEPLTKESADYAMVKSIHDMASYMHKHTIAEAVNNSEVLDLIKEIGIDYAVGGEFNKHMMIDELTNLPFAKAAS